MLEPMGYLGLITKPSDSSNDLNSCFQMKDFPMATAKCVDIKDQMYVEQDTMSPKRMIDINQHHLLFGTVTMKHCQYFRD